MATFTAIQAGNWTAWQTWFAGDPGGGEGSQYPGNGDVADCAGFAVTMNLTTTPASGNLAEMKSTGSGYFVWRDAAGGAMTVNCTKFTVGGTGAGTGGVFRHTATTAGNSLTVISSQTSGEGLIGATGGTTPYGFTRAGDEKFTFRGRITGGSGASGVAVYLATTGGTISFTSNVVGGSNTSAQGIRLATNREISIAIPSGGSITGGSASLAQAIYSSTATSTISITGNNSVTGDIVGGSHVTAHGVYILGAVEITNCNLTNGEGLAISGSSPTTYSPAAGNWWDFGAWNFAKEVAPADLKSGVVNGTVTGTYKGGAGARMKQIGIGVF